MGGLYYSSACLLGSTTTTTATATATAPPPRPADADDCHQAAAGEEVRSSLYEPLRLRHTLTPRHPLTLLHPLPGTRSSTAATTPTASIVLTSTTALPRAAVSTATPRASILCCCSLSCSHEKAATLDDDRWQRRLGFPARVASPMAQEASPGSAA